MLFTDLADYTAQVSRTDREGLRQLLRGHEEAVRPMVEAHHGRVVKNIGDSFLCLFPAATEALRAAMEILEADHAVRTAGIRLALATGDVEEIEGDAFGATVNLAARIMGVTPAGECWFSRGTRYAMNEAEVAWEEVGSFGLKGIPGEQTCYRAVPAHRTTLPIGVTAAARGTKLVVFRPGESPQEIPSEAVALFLGFQPGSQDLADALRLLPALRPADVYLAAYTISAGERAAWTEAGRGLVVGTVTAIDEALHAVAVRQAKNALEDSSTMLLDLHSQVDLRLVMCGLALPTPPIGQVVAGYGFDLLADGSWAARSDRAVLRVEVENDQPVLRALGSDISVDGTLLSPGATRRLTDGNVIQGLRRPVQFRSLEGPYLGVLLAEGDSWLGVLYGQTIELGRKPNPPGLTYAPRDGDGNLRWFAGPRAEKARENNFTLDRYLTGRRQAAIELSRNGIRLVPLHDECRTYLLRRDGLQLVERPVQVTMGDMVVAGTFVVSLRPPT